MCADSLAFLFCAGGISAFGGLIIISTASMSYSRGESVDLSPALCPLQWGRVKMRAGVTDLTGSKMRMGN